MEDRLHESVPDGAKSHSGRLHAGQDCIHLWKPGERAKDGLVHADGSRGEEHLFGWSGEDLIQVG